MSALLDAALGSVQHILIDSSVIIAYLERGEAVHPLAAHVLLRVGDPNDGLHASCSAISASEVLVRPIRSGPQAFGHVHGLFTALPKLSLLNVDLPVAVQAATIRAITGLRPPDAMVVASGLLAGCEAIVSNDERWKRRLEPLFKQFRWIYLGDYL